MTRSVSSYLHSLPKAELHVHLEGSIQPGSKLRFAARNGLTLRETSAEEVIASYDFHDLESCLRCYNEGLEVLRQEIDYFELTYEYLEISHSQNVRHAEMHFDPQMHLARGVSYETFMAGINRARQTAFEKLGITSGLILAFYWEHGGIGWQEAFDHSAPYKDDIIAVAFYPYSAEGFRPADQFAGLVTQARARGHKVTAHCNGYEQHSVDTIRECMNTLRLDRIDHGPDVVQDPDLVDEAKKRNLCFTVCPGASANWPGPFYLPELRQMFDLGMTVTVNSDDPGYFLSRYLGDVYQVVSEQDGFSEKDLEASSRNALSSAWMDEDRRAELLAELDKVVHQ